jgi:hypothetical protein
MKTIKAKTVALVIAMSASTSVYAFPGYQWEKAAQSAEESPDDLQINHQIRVEAHLVA